MKETIDSLLAAHGPALACLEKVLQYHFYDKRVMLLGLVHSSHAYEQAEDPEELNNERLEFLGDAVIDLVVGHALFRRYPRMREGELSKLRAALVNENHLALMANELGLGPFLLLGKGEENSHGREKASILACGYEALIGAVFSDGGYEAAKEVIKKHFASWVEKGVAILQEMDAKSRLQEMLQEQFGAGPSYFLEQAEGPDHCKVFTVSARFRGKVLAMASSGSKKEAEQKAAAGAITRIMENDLRMAPDDVGIEERKRHGPDKS